MRFKNVPILRYEGIKSKRERRINGSLETALVFIGSAFLAYLVVLSITQ